MKLLVMSFGFLVLSQCVGCGDGSDVPEALRAPPQEAATPANADPAAPPGSMPAEDH